MSAPTSNFAAMSATEFNPGLDVRFAKEKLDFCCGDGVFGPQPEYRSLDSIRQSLRDPDCSGPDPVYAIAMGVGRNGDQEELRRRMLLFGIVMYSSGALGDELVRSQGHVHKVTPHCGWSPPELIEVWEGRALLYCQENSGDNPGRCIAVECRPGDRVVVPPGWAHYIANAEPDSVLIFGAWCDRQYGFDYGPMRAHGGLAWFPLIAGDGKIRWEANPNYFASWLECRKARTYPELGISSEYPLYGHLRRDPKSLQWVSDPCMLGDFWQRFEP